MNTVPSYHTSQPRFAPRRYQSLSPEEFLSPACDFQGDGVLLSLSGREQLSELVHRPSPRRERGPGNVFPAELILSLPRGELFDPECCEMLLRLAGERPLRLLISQIQGPEQMEGLRFRLTAAHRSLHTQGCPCAKTLPCGVVLDHPGTALLAKEFAAVCDFLVLDPCRLFQALFSDGEPKPETSGCTAGHPALLKLLRLCSRASHARYRPLGISGSWALRPELLSLWQELGVDELFLSTPSQTGYTSSKTAAQTE